MSKVELKVNVISQLRLLRQSTFKDILCFLDEDIQNAQRAKATEVKVYASYWEEKIIIENNGQILKDPQCLFSIAESGWDEDVKTTENPFGMGFFSNITISNVVEVYSGKLHITFDVDKMINTNNTEILVEEVEDEYQGFKLVLNNVDFSNIYTGDIEERVKLLGNYVHELDIYYNDKLQEKKDLMQGDGSPFQIQLNEDTFKGWLSVGNNYCYNDNINIFYKGRLVCKLPNVPYVNGDIHVSDKALNLTSPDRKDIIKDNKYQDFKTTIREYATLLCEDTFLNGDQEEMNEYANALTYYVDKRKIKNKIKFVTFKSTDSSDIKYLKDIAQVKKENNDIKSFSGYELYLNTERNKQSESHLEEVEIHETIVHQVPVARGTYETGGYSSYSGGSITTPKIKEDEVESKLATSIITNDQPVFWLSFDDVATYEFKLNMVKHYDLRIVVARNRVESEILKLMKTTDKVLHISELDETVDIKGYLSNTEVNDKEKRALMIFDMLSRMLGFDHNIFAIGDLMVTKTVTVDSLNMKNEIVENSVTVIRDRVANKVYVDRSIIDTSDLRASDNPKLTLHDYKFILCNLYSIVDQVSLISDKNKQELFKEILTILGHGII